MLYNNDPIKSEAAFWKPPEFRDCIGCLAQPSIGSVGPQLGGKLRGRGTSRQPGTCYGELLIWMLVAVDQQ